MPPSSDSMKWASALSTRPFLEAAVEEVTVQAQERLQAEANLGFIFISSAFASEYSRLLPLLQEKLPGVPLVGCSGGGVIGVTSREKVLEVEGEPALGLTLAHLPDVQVKPFHIIGDELPDLDGSPQAWAELIGVAIADQPQLVLFADPFSARINDLLQGLDYAYPTAAKIGGLASSGMMGGSSGLFCDNRFYREGTVGVALSGNIAIDTIVAQGCRPIGQPYWVTEGERHIILALKEDDGSGDVTVSCPGSRSPLELLQGLIQSLDEDDRQLATQENRIFIGIAQNEFKQTLDQGDFLIRTLMGVDPRLGAIAIGDRIRPGQRIQFHLRDSETSADDLEMLLERFQQTVPSNPSPAAALMFACLGRGEALYGEPNFDSQLFHEYVNSVPVSGFFCNGEIGPVGSNTFLHGYTSVFGICRAKE